MDLVSSEYVSVPNGCYFIRKNLNFVDTYIFFFL